MITHSAKKKQRNKKSGGRGWTKSEKGGGGVLHEIWGDRDPLSTI